MRANIIIKLNSSSYISLLQHSILLIILVRLIIINLVIILRSIRARHGGNRCIYACAYKFGQGEVITGISRVFAVPTFLSTACPLPTNTTPNQQQKSTQDAPKSTHKMRRPYAVGICTVFLVYQCCVFISVACQQSFGLSSRAYAELRQLFASTQMRKFATLSRPARQLARACKIDVSHKPRLSGYLQCPRQKKYLPYNRSRISGVLWLQ